MASNIPLITMKLGVLLSIAASIVYPTMISMQGANTLDKFGLVSLIEVTIQKVPATEMRPIKYSVSKYLPGKLSLNITLQH